MISRGDIKNNPLWEDLKEIFEKPDTAEMMHVSGIVHTVHEDIPIFKIISEENTRNYAQQTAEFYFITAYMAAGDYLYRIYPYRDNLEVSIKKTWMTQRGDIDPDRPPVVRRYKALFNPEANPAGTNEAGGKMDIQDLNRLAPVTMVLELQDRAEEALRTKSVSGVFKNITMEDMIRAATYAESRKVTIEGKPILDAIDIVKPDNEEPYPYLLLTSNLYLEDLPGWLQEKAKGVYNAGIGSFFQRFEDKATWFVYPLYNDKRYDQAGKKIMIFSVPPERMQGVTTTYRQEGDVTYIAATGDSDALKTAYNRELNQGVGFRFPDGEALMNKPVEIEGDKIVARRRHLNYEYANYDRKDQNPYAPYYQGTANPYFLMSRNLGYQMVLHFVTWENSNPELIYPGMPCRYVFIDKGIREEVDGTVVFCYTTSLLQGNPLEDRHYQKVTQLGLMLGRRESDPENPPTTLVTGDDT